MDHVELSGTGTAQTTPDIATLRLGVSFPAKTVGDALGGCAEITTRVLQALKDMGITGRDVQTTSLSVDPQWDPQRPEIVGHTANQYLNVRLRELPKIGAAISAASESAGNALRMDSLSWSVSNPEPLHDKARELAFAAALDKAKALADLGGRALGRVTRIHEDDAGSWGGGGGREYKMLSAAAADMPTEAGEQGVSVTVRVRWQLLDR
ncbi:MAG TPA: SIMPL domain-containing protein [Marmoricola sp.]|nr:SIMPL domain-containing protein [Marmoricola sp.]